MRRGHVGSEGDLAFLASCQMNGDDRMASQRRDHLPFIAYTIHLITHQGTGIVQIEQSFVVGVACMSGHREIEVAEGLIGHTHILSGTHGHYLLIGQYLGLFVLSLEDELAYFRQISLRLRVEHLIRLSCPKGFLIELDMLCCGCTEDHPTDDTIAYGQCLCPGLCRTVVP